MKATTMGGGIESIFRANTLPSVEDKSGIRMLNLTDIEPKADQPRKYFEEEALNALAESIKENGLLQPIVVKKSANGFYQIIAGERRWRACGIAGLSKVPCSVINADELQSAKLSLIENIQRENLNPYETARAYDHLIRTFGLTQEQVAVSVGKSRSAVTNSLRLLELPESVLTYLIDGSLSEGHAKVLLGLKDEDALKTCAELVVAKGLSVRETEVLVKKMNREKKEVVKEPQSVDYAKILSEKAMSILGKQVKINDKGKVKSVSIEYVDNEDLEALLLKLCGKDILE